MRNEKKQLIIDLLGRVITLDNFFSESGMNAQNANGYILNILQNEYTGKDAEGVELALSLGFYVNSFSLSYIPILSDLIVADWHQRHEDIASIFQRLKAPESIDPVVKSMHLKFNYWYDDGDAFIRKCSYVLGEIGTDYAIEKLKELSNSDNDIISKYCNHQLKKRNK